jgi:hypothetical protein
MTQTTATRTAEQAYHEHRDALQEAQEKLYEAIRLLEHDVSETLDDLIDRLDEIETDDRDILQEAQEKLYKAIRLLEHDVSETIDDLIDRLPQED